MVADDGELWADALRPVRPRDAARAARRRRGEHRPDGADLTSETVAILAAVGSLKTGITDLEARLGTLELRLAEVARSVSASRRPAPAVSGDTLDAIGDAVRAAVAEERSRLEQAVASAVEGTVSRAVAAAVESAVSATTATTATTERESPVGAPAQPARKRGTRAVAPTPAPRAVAAAEHGTADGSPDVPATRPGPGTRKPPTRRAPSSRPTPSPTS